MGSLATPVAFAFAEERGASPRDVIAAMTAGYEIGARVGNAATMSLFFRGFHPQGTSGAFAAAATAAHMLKLDANAVPARARHRRLAGRRTHGGAGRRDGEALPFAAARRKAASMRRRSPRADFTGITDVLEAPYGGYLTCYSNEPNPARLTAGLGSTWETLNVGYKPHASRHEHPHGARRARGDHARERAEGGRHRDASRRA